MSVPRFWREIESRYNLVGSHCKITNTYHYPKRSFNPEAGRESIGNMELDRGPSGTDRLRDVRTLLYSNN